ncbi:PIN domain-containing protein [Phormidium nigroviride]
MLLDSNVIIYASQPEHAQVRQFIGEHDIVVSAVSYVEVLGYHRLTEENRLYVEEFFSVGEVLPISNAVLDRAHYSCLSGKFTYLRQKSSNG